MAKYIDADKIRAEIERRKNEGAINKQKASENNDIENYVAWDQQEAVMGVLIRFIDSLQQEPEVDIVREIDELWESLNTGHDYVIVDSYQDFLGICLHCFELGFNARKEE